MERLIVDGYNIIFAWPELSAAKDVKLEDARDLLIAILADYAAMTRQKVTVVFDSHRRADAEASTQTINGGQVDAVLARRNEQIGDSRARSDIARRLEDRLDPRTRERLDQMRRGEVPPK